MHQLLLHPHLLGEVELGRYGEIWGDMGRYGACLARLNWPPMDGERSKSVTLWPRSAATVAQASPAGPAPTTARLSGACGGRCFFSVSPSPSPFPGADPTAKFEGLPPPEITRDYPRLPETTREYPRVPESTREYPRVPETTREYPRVPPPVCSSAPSRSRRAD